MLDDFFTRAIIAGLATAALMGPIGCFIIWRRMSFFGDTLSHSALLGVGLGLLLHTNQTITVFLTALLIAALLHLLRGRANLSSDASLGILSHGALALGLLMVSFLPPSQIDFTSIFFGDILATSPQDIYIILSALIIGLAILKFIWHPLLIATINQDIAKAETRDNNRAEFIFTLLLTMVIALSLKIVGVLLISADMSNTPTIFNDSAMTMVNNNVKINSALLLSLVSALAISWFMVAINRGCQMNFKIAKPIISALRMI